MDKSIVYKSTIISDNTEAVRLFCNVSRFDKRVLHPLDNMLSEELVRWQIFHEV